ncbi:MAG: U32 family peptidase C-terminal domain-containing protein, partial [Sphaerochaetaceae bacterium]|nr:U32 family peptidase C-terminal domain-containing protein [Sphaerochaetaceae bacterium]
KIEGRMKSTYYVASVTRAYRKALDNLYDSSVEYKSFRDELFNVSHREFSTGFFYGNGPIEVLDEDKNVVIDDINKATDKTYLRDYLFLGTVKEEVKPGIWSLDIKNQIKKGTPIEYIGPDILYLKDVNPVVLDENFNEIDHIDHCRNGYLKTSAPLKEDYIIRKEIRV